MSFMICMHNDVNQVLSFDTHVICVMWLRVAHSTVYNSQDMEAT